MGGIKRLFGGSSTPTVTVAPSVQAVQSAETSADTTNSATKKKKPTGFASTQNSNLLNNASSTTTTNATDGTTSGRPTLG